MKVLVTGGAGYIGSQVLLALADVGRRPVVVDDLSTGFAKLIPDDVPLYVGDFGDPSLLDRIFSEHEIGAVMHFAARTVVPESIERPLDYYENNAAKTLCLLRACIRHRVARFIFSSTAAVYGSPGPLALSETAPTAPISPYGASKLMVERFIQDVANAYSLDFVILRYFNVAGADLSLRTGQTNRNATHLVKVAVQAALGLREEVLLYGTDYETSDGTCIRDYIHVADLANAHVAALAYLEQGGRSGIFNCGYGRGYSVREVLDTVSRITQKNFAVRPVDRRAGDAPQVVADCTRIRDVLGWRPSHDDLELIVRTSFEYEKTIRELES